MDRTRGSRHDSDVLLHQIDANLARVHAGDQEVESGGDLLLAEAIAAALRRLVEGTAESSAVDRARARAAVHYFLVRGDMRRERRMGRSLATDVRVINEIMHDLGRDDLAIAAAPPLPQAI